MLPQKNSGNRAKKSHRESGASVKSKAEVNEIFKNIDGTVDSGKYICKVIKKLGNGNVEVMYPVAEEKRVATYNKQAKIRGSFRGRGKRDVWIDIGSFVIAEQNLNILEIVGVITRQEMKDIVSLDSTYKKLLSGSTEDEDDVAVEFDERDEESLVKDQTELGVMNKKDKKKHNRQNIQVETNSDNDSDVNVDDI